MRNAIGFYWTLPVPWAGFGKLPETIDDAAKASHTIRYQCELIRRHAKDRNYRLVAEEVFLEIAPDRGSEYIREPLCDVEKTCRAHAAVLLYVDFSAVQGWRSHGALSNWAAETEIEVETVYPGEIVIDGKTFDPDTHFSEWRARQHKWTEGRKERVIRALAKARRLRAEGRTHESIA